MDIQPKEVEEADAALVARLSPAGRRQSADGAAALVLYMIAFLITISVNVPLNNDLDKAGDPARIADLAAVRQHFEDKWVTSNIIRTVFHTAALACLAWALAVHGAHRDQPSSAAEPPPPHHPSILLGSPGHG